MTWFKVPQVEPSQLPRPTADQRHSSLGACSDGLDRARMRKFAEFGLIAPEGSKLPLEGGLDTYEVIRTPLHTDTKLAHSVELKVSNT